MSASSAYVAYYRVSTAKQGASGLGLEAQMESVRRFVKEKGTVYSGPGIVASYTEVESGRNCARSQLAAALAECRRRKATLLIAKLDRLSRNVAFLATLLEGDVAIIAVDMPNADRTFLQMMAVMAEHEARICSERTKSALKAAKARGVVLGGFRGRHLTDAERAQGNAVKAAAARQRALEVLPAIEEARASGAVSLKAIAEQLNARGIPTTRGGPWQPTQVMRALQRAA